MTPAELDEYWKGCFRLVPRCELHEPHEVRDRKKLAQIEAAMREHGWQGAPLVLFDGLGMLVTGSHRMEAATNIGMHDVPVIELRDILSNCDIDGYDELLVERGCSWTDPESMWLATETICEQLSEEVREYFGLQFG